MKFFYLILSLVISWNVLIAQDKISKESCNNAINKQYREVANSSFNNNQQFYYLGKVWGFIKYHHTNVAKGYINWDEKLMIAIDSLENCKSNQEFNVIVNNLIDEAGTMGVSSADLPIVPDSLMFGRNVLWINDDVFDSEIQNSLTDILEKFRPQSNVYINNEYGQNPDFFDDMQYYQSVSSFPYKSLRLLALFRYWNIINYFFPYKNIIDQDWDQTLIEFIPQIVESSNLAEYHLDFPER